MNLFDSLQEAPYKFDFFEALRRLECEYPDNARLGESLHTGKEHIRLGQDPTMAFAPSTISSFTHNKEGGPPRLGVYFFGLHGANGPLPLHLTEFIYDRLHNSHDPTLTAFLDVFHHRLLTLFYRAWANSQPTVSFDRPGKDTFGNYVATLFGSGGEALQDRDAMPDLAKRYYAGRLAPQTHNKEGLQAVIQDFFKLPASIEEFTGEWMDLPDNSVCRLGQSDDISTLGVTILLGEQVWQSQHKFRIVIGAVNFIDYKRLLPGGKSLQRLVAMVKNYVGEEFNWELQLILEEPEVPNLPLDGNSQLGYTSWLTQGALGRDGDDLVLCPTELRGLQ